MTNRFDYIRYDQIAVEKQTNAKILFSCLEQFAETQLPAGRAKSLVLTKLEEAYMWVGKAIRDEQISDRTAELQEERNNE